MEGTYLYAVASVRQDNGETAVSALSETVSAASDATAPESPQALTLELQARAYWPNGQLPPERKISPIDSIGTLGQILAVDGLTPVLDGVLLTEAIDAQPSVSTPYYAVTAVDASGNESPPSASTYLNLDLLPVASLTAIQTDDDAPVINWSHTGGNIAGFNLYIGPDGALLKINDDLIAAGPHTDTGYGGDERRYTVTAVDDQQNESLPRSITLPSIGVMLAEGQEIKRGVMNRLEYRIENMSDSPVANAVLKVRVHTHDHVSAQFTS